MRTGEKTKTVRTGEKTKTVRTGPHGAVQREQRGASRADRTKFKQPPQRENSPTER